MRTWERRSVDEANLLNPAFLSVIAYQCVKGYSETTGNSAPYILPFLVSPLVLPKKSRKSLPRTVGTAFTSWITKPQGTAVKVSYAPRASSLVPYIREALLFSIANGVLTQERDCSFLTRKTITVDSLHDTSFTDEVEECFKKAYFCGRWLARVGKIETVMALLGVRP